MQPLSRGNRNVNYRIVKSCARDNESMKAPFELYKKIFLDTAIPFGLLVGVFVGLKEGFASGAYTAIVGGVFFGFVMALAMGTWHYRAVRNMTLEYGENLLQLQQVRLLTVEAGHSEAFDACLKALQLMTHCTVGSHDKVAGRIEARIGGWDIPDKIEVDVKAAAAGQSKISVSSKPPWRSIIVDNGSNAKNVQSIIEALSKELKVVDQQIANPLAKQ